jgi:tetratricopeptide (TPR) repeat protein
VTGSLLSAGREVRVTTQLTEAVTGTLLWSNATQAPVGDVFRVQDDLTQRIVASLSLPLTRGEQQLLKRDVPANAAAFEFFLRGNQLASEAKQWVIARDLYQRSVEEDPRYAPAWARLGRIHHVIGKYLAAGTPDNLAHAETAFRRALDLNPDLTLAHKLYAQLEVDLGRGSDAMARLIERAHVADPELLAGLVTTCRYCGLLDASVAAHTRAAELEPKIRTSLPHTLFLQRDYARLAAATFAANPYIVALALAEVGRGHDALTALRDLEPKTPTRMRDFIGAARTLLEGDDAASVAAVNRVVGSDFRDPEALYYMARQLSHLRQSGPALEVLDRVVGGGFFCFPAMATDPWLDPLRKKPAFGKLLGLAEARHADALATFERLGGNKVLALAATVGS